MFGLATSLNAWTTLPKTVCSKPMASGAGRPQSLAISTAQLDFVREGLNEGFRFSNPNERDRCGCGESFRVSILVPAALVKPPSRTVLAVLLI